MEELLSQDGEPIASQVRSLLTATDLTKAAFCDRLNDIIRQTDELDKKVVQLSNRGRNLTADRKEKTVTSLMPLMSIETKNALQDAYAACSGEGEDLSLVAYAASVGAVLQDVQRMEDRTISFYDLGKDAANAYKTALGRYMGEPVTPRTVLRALEELAQTEAYAIRAALQADPEAARKKEPISFGNYAQNMAFLIKVTQELCPMPDGSSLPVPYADPSVEDMDLFALAFRFYPGMAFLKVYTAHGTDAQRSRWANAPDGYLAGLAVHGAYAIVPYLDDFGLDYIQYRWYEDILYVTLTGISALLIHYYGYSPEDLTAYLKSWGAEDYAAYLYDSALSDPFESLTASYGYWQYLTICQAALDAGCEDEHRFLQDYLSAGPAPFAALKEYMVSLYQKQG